MLSILSIITHNIIRSLTVYITSTERSSTAQVLEHSITISWISFGYTLVSCTHPIDITVCIHERIGLIEEVPACTYLNVKRAKSLFPWLRSNQNYTITCTRTIDSSSTSILEHLHVLNIFWVDVSHAITELAIDNVQWRARAIKIGTPTNNYWRLCARVTWGLCNSHPSDSSRKSLSRVWIYPYRKHLFLNRRDRVCNLITTNLTAITSNHYFVKRRSRLVHDNLKCRCPIDCYLMSSKSYISKVELLYTLRDH